MFPHALLAFSVAISTALASPEAGKPPATRCTETMGAYCNASVPTEERIKNLLSLATLEEKIAHVTHGGIPRLGVPAVPVGEALHGVNAGCGVDSAGREYCPTSFPSALGLGASLNDSLWNLVGSTISTESRALVPAGGARWTPDINLFRDPRWGRGQEVPGEDPVLTSRYATAYVRGLQEGDDPRYIKVIATCKHFFAYDVDYVSTATLANPNGTITYDRHSFNAVVGKADLVEYYLPAFEACATQGRAGSIMCSYNAMNSTPSCANAEYQNGVLRDAWGWGVANSSTPLEANSTAMSKSVMSPYIVSDCSAIGDMAAENYRCSTKPGPPHNPGHNYVQTEAEAAVAAIKAGTDMNCGCEYAAHLADAVGNGTVAHSDIDLAAGRITHAVIRTGGLDPQGKDSPYANIPTTKINDDAAAQLALEAAQQSIVLLQNKPVGDKTDSSGSPLLPLKLSGATKVAMVGPHANATDAMRSNYCGENKRVLSNSPSEAAIRKWAGKAEITVVPGLNNTVGRPWDADGVAAAVAAAKAADIAIVFVGLTPCQGSLAGPWYAPTCNEGESHDRNEHTADLGSLELPGSQQALVEAVAKVNPNYVVVLINGGALGIDWIKQNSPAVVEAFYPGESGGPAIIDVLDGTFNPVGKLPYTIYPAAFNLTRPITDMSLRGGEGITHLHYTGAALWKFGSGSSYTKFAVSIVSRPLLVLNGTEVETFIAQSAQGQSYSVRVQNVGAVPGGTRVLGFVTCDDPEVYFPKQRLFGFNSVDLLEPTASTTVTLKLPTPKQLSVADEAGRQWLHPASYSIHIGTGPPGDAEVTVHKLVLRSDARVLL